MRVLVVEDSKRRRETPVAGLRKAGYAVDAAEDGSTRLWQARCADYGVIVLDLMIPGVDGMTVLRQLRAEGRDTHVLILTARDAVEDRAASHATLGGSVQLMARANGAVNDHDDGTVDDRDEAQANNGDDGAADHADDGTVNDHGDGTVDDRDRGQANNGDDDAVGDTVGDATNDPGDGPVNNGDDGTVGDPDDDPAGGVGDAATGQNDDSQIGEADDADNEPAATNVR